ncbi:MAG: DUF2207 domain-containing protein [Oscillospiraceae bacterium]|nr:DUF2207 domain-containing protein [Oscillospiraceae bacterium]
MFRLSSKIAALLTALFLLPSVALAYEPFVIESYSVDISVDKARVHSVREELSLNFTSQSHGLIREIPLSSSQEPYKIASVSASDPFTLESGTNVLGIRLGDPYQYVYGPKSYVLTYDMVYAKDGDSESDIVYITPIGTEWDTSIENAEVTVTLPTDQIKSVAVYRGEYGNSTDIGGAEIVGNTVRLTADRLSRHEGLTLYISLPEGTFTDAPRSLTPVQDVLVFGLILLAAVILAMAFSQWLKSGRDEDIIPMVEFYPPDDMNPAELAYVMKNSVSPSDISAMIFFWASKGYIRYTETEKGGFVLERLSPISPDRPNYERAAFEALFAAGSDGKVTNKQIEKKYYEAAQTAIINTEESFRGQRALEEVANRRTSVLFLLSCLSAPIIYGVLSLINEPGDTVLLSFLGLIPPIIAYVLTYRLIQRKNSSGFMLILKAVFISALIALSCFIASRFMETRFFGSVPRCLSITALSSLAAVFAALVNRRTDYATRLIGRCTGFRNFLKTAEKSRIEALIGENPAYFFDTLPFAVVLGVTDVWAKKFEGLIKEPPSWYTGYGGRPFTPYVMTRTAMSTVTSLSRVYAQREVKNSGNGRFGGGGFSGGGFSGGGGGGGGGRAW